ncbi:hypothetical protein, partial [Campylobacter rectus]|uniref:hypothetical protein n=1 Tax=Campylobacter rectus TaxID=203 RepID=UPI0028EAFC63
ICEKRTRAKRKSQREIVKFAHVLSLSFYSIFIYRLKISQKLSKEFFSKRVRLISSKQNAAKHKSCDLRYYCLLKGYEFSEIEQTEI